MNGIGKRALIAKIAEETKLPKNRVAAVLDELEHLMERHLRKSGPGKFTLPGLMKITTVRKKPAAARKGINPFTGEETVFKAKPARTVLKIRPLKRLKDAL